MNSPLDRHEKIAASFSGGKDSTAVVELLREHLDRITLYHLDAGDLLPEIAEAVARIEASVPHFVRVQTDSNHWISEHGMPSDLMPYSAHQIGRLMGEPGKVRLVSRYDCCWANLMAPIWDRIRNDGNTLLIRGTKEVDMRSLPVGDGETTEGVEIWLPLLGWSNADVFAFLASRGVPIPRIYSYMTNSPECARCPAWWNEQRNFYLKRYYPALHAEYQDRLRVIAGEVMPSMAAFMREWEGVM